MRPIVLSIAGSDPSGGAGVQADLKTIEACGGHAVTVITAVTVQNGRCVRRAGAVDAELVADQLDAILDDLPVAAVKSGMLAETSIVRLVADRLRRARPAHYVLDPVTRSTDGFPLLAAEATSVLIDELLPLASLVTPSVSDLQALTGLEVHDAEQAERAGRILLDHGARAVLVKGGDLSGPEANDVLLTRSGRRCFSVDRVDTVHTHGTGCVLASAIATELALGSGLEPAVLNAKRFVTQAIRHGRPLGDGRGPTDPLFELPGRRRVAGEVSR